ncbi:hypothetical protein MMC17_010247 [Xylographa soralifera]|nr:hypothetical protein [Xylographa soralifera]
MSFGFGVGDFIAVGTLAWNVYGACKGAEKDFKLVTGEVKYVLTELLRLSKQLNFYFTLAQMRSVPQDPSLNLYCPRALHSAFKRMEIEIADPNSLLNREGASRKDELDQIISNSTQVLCELEEIVKRYSKLSRVEKPFWRLRYAAENADAIRGRLSFQISTISLFYDSLQIPALARMERSLDQVLSARGTLHRTPSILSAVELQDVLPWQELEKELLDSGVSKEDLILNMAEIKALLTAKLLEGQDVALTTNGNDQLTLDASSIRAQNLLETTAFVLDEGSQNMQAESNSDSDSDGASTFESVFSAFDELSLQDRQKYLADSVEKWHIPGLPDLIVGVDLGMTYSSVAYATLNMVSPNTIQQWPGKATYDQPRVPTRLDYTKSYGNAVAWGYLCDDSLSISNNGEVYRVEWFKPYLDSSRLTAWQKIDKEAPSMEEIKQWYKDYLRYLYKHIQWTIEQRRGAWKDQQIQFLFSLPTTWTSMATIEDFRDMINSAGYCNGGSKHSALVGLTEAQAAAAYTSSLSIQLRRGDIILICDAGGGTTDLCLLRMTGTQQHLEFKEIDIVSGANVGSTNIDVAFEKLVATRMRKGRNQFFGVGRDMAQSHAFQNLKCSFGGPEDCEAVIYSVRIPTVSNDYCDLAAGINSGSMTFTREEIRQLFDVEIEKIVNLINAKLDKISEHIPNGTLDYLVLCGGLGSSSYARDYLMARYNQYKTKVVVSDDPQLAVAKGLVIDQIRKSTFGTAVITSRRSRASYGILCSERYDASKHIGEYIYTNTLDMLEYAKDQITWLIKKGDEIKHEESMNVDFVRDARILCEIDANVSLIEENLFKEQNQRLFTQRPRYLEAQYSLKMIVGPADLRFELWFNGKQYAQNSVNVTWDAVARESHPELVSLRIDENIETQIRASSG